jgi:hypothetical protein
VEKNDNSYLFCRQLGLAWIVIGLEDTATTIADVKMFARMQLL